MKKVMIGLLLGRERETKITAAIILGLILLTGAAHAEDPAVLTIRQAVEINAALGQICEQKLVGSEVKCIPFSPDRLKTELAWRIAGVQRKVAEVAAQYQKVVNAFLVTLPRDPKGDLPAEANVRFLNYQSDLLDKPALPPGEKIEHFKRTEIEPLGLQPSTLASLLSIIDQ